MTTDTNKDRNKQTNHQQVRLTLGLLAATCFLSPAALAVGAHEHGHARLQMAVEQSRIDLIFNSPAHNLAGFEHEARTEDEKNQLTEIRQWLETTPLINTGSSGCSVTATSVELGGATAMHDEDEHDHHHHEEHADHADEETSHREYDISQQLECGDIESAQVFSSALLERFQQLEELTVEWVSASGQGSARLTNTNQSFSIND